jgi:hypothetical protein
VLAAGVFAFARYNSLVSQNAELQGQLTSTRLEAAGLQKALAEKPKTITNTITKWLPSLEKEVSAATEAGGTTLVGVKGETEVVTVVVPKEVIKTELPADLNLNVQQRAEIALFSSPNGDVFWAGKLFADLTIPDWGWAQTAGSEMKGEVVVNDELRKAIQDYHNPPARFRFTPRGFTRMRAGWTVGPGAFYTGSDFQVGVGVVWGLQF